MKEKEYTTEDWVAIHQEFFTLAREVEDLRLHGELLSAFIKSFQIGYDLGFQEGMNFEKLQQISEKFMFPSLRANEPVKPDTDHPQFKMGFLEGHKIGKCKSIDPLLPQDMKEMIDLVRWFYPHEKSLSFDTIVSNLKNWREQK